LIRTTLIGLLLSSTAMIAQSKNKTIPAELEAPTTLPIVFTKTIVANHSHVGDVVTAKTSQVVLLSNGAVIPSGAKVTGHVVAANGFSYDKTPYARQKVSTLTIKFDSVQVGESTLPLITTVRAMADPISSEQAHFIGATDIDPQGTTTQIGGDEVTPRVSEVVNRDGDVVGMSVKKAVTTSCRVRLRPILMTSLATLIGLLPMALKLGEGSESYAPLAQALIGGLTLSVLLTIFLVPTGFYLAYRNRPVE
jgi:AcrB/AcrD/AcrF family